MLITEGMLEGRKYFVALEEGFNWLNELPHRIYRENVRAKASDDDSSLTNDKMTNNQEYSIWEKILNN